MIKNQIITVIISIIVFTNLDLSANEHCEVTLPNASRYNGESEKGLFSASGDRYSGEYKNGLGDGAGTYEYANGDRFVGEFSKGRRNGEGVYYKQKAGEMIQGVWDMGENTGVTQEATCEVPSDLV